MTFLAILAATAVVGVLLGAAMFWAVFFVIAICAVRAAVQAIKSLDQA